MPTWLPLKKDDVLPLFVTQRPTSSSFFIRVARKWNSLHRLNRTFLIGITTLIIIFLVYVQMVSLPSQVELIHSSNDRVEAVEEGKIVPDVPNNLPIVRLDVNNSTIPQFSEPTNDRQRAVRNAFKHAWKGYKQFAWGHDHLTPVSKSYSEWMECGLTLVDSLDTLLIMNLKEEFDEARKWVAESLTFEKDIFVNLFETTIRVLGGLLTAFHLTGDNMFKVKATDIGDRLIGAFASPSPIPYSDVNMKTKAAKQPGWGGESSLSEVTSIQLEFRELSRITQNDTYEKSVFKVSEHIHSIGCNEKGGLCEMFLSPSTGKFRKSTTITFGARADSYYEYLLKQWLQTGKTISWLRTDYEQAMDAMEQRLWRKSEPNGYGFIGELLGGDTYSPKMDHLVCFLAGTLALGTQHGLPQKHMELAKNLSRTCYEMYRTPTGLAPEIVYFNLLPGRKDDITIKPLDAHSLLRPEAFESWFYMYRITRDPMYQEWGWEAFQAIEKYAKVEHGYSSINNCKKIPVVYRNIQESFFLSESLKYLYLLLADDQTILPLNRYVFNTEAHPLPIRLS